MSAAERIVAFWRGAQRAAGCHLSSALGSPDRRWQFNLGSNVRHGGRLAAVRPGLISGEQYEDVDALAEDAIDARP